MRLTMCENRHWYDADKSDGCPFCRQIRTIEGLSKAVAAGKGIKQIKMQDWIFNIDTLDTARLYNRRIVLLPEETLPYLKKYPNNLKDFLEQCGIDITTDMNYDNGFDRYADPAFQRWPLLGIAYSDSCSELHFLEDGKCAKVKVNVLLDSFHNGKCFRAFELQVFC